MPFSGGELVRRKRKNKIWRKAEELRAGEMPSLTEDTRSIVLRQSTCMFEYITSAVRLDGYRPVLTCDRIHLYIEGNHEDLVDTDAKSKNV
jgi:hypothetical protein